MKLRYGIMVCFAVTTLLVAGISRSATREVWQGAKKAGKEIGHEAMKAGQAVGGAAKEGAKEFKRAFKGEK